MASDEKWYFTKEQLENTPSRQFGIDSQRELVFRQQSAYFIQEMGQRLRVTQLCINTASVYMHRFYVFHSFTHFPWNSIAAASLFLAAKVEEQPRKLEHVIRVHNICKNPRDVAFDVNSDRYQQQSQDLVFNENVLLQTLGFDVVIDHPHSHVVRCCHLVRASKDLAQTSYFMASTSLHITTMCLQYKPTVVACFCIHLACKWSNWEIPLSNEKKEWYSYVDSTVTTELLLQLTDEFLATFGKCSSRIKEKIMAIGDNASLNLTRSHPSTSTTETDSRKQPSADAKDTHHRIHHHEKTVEEHKHRPRASHETAGGSSSSSTSVTANSTTQQQREREYREKKERERLAHQHKLQHAATGSSATTKLPTTSHGSHHRIPVDVKQKAHARPNAAAMRPEQHLPRDTNRDTVDIKDVLTSSAVRGDKDMPDKRLSYPSKPNSDSNATNIHPEHFSGDKRADAGARTARTSTEPKLLVHKHESKRHAADESKAAVKSDPDARKHLAGQSSSQPSWFEFNKSSNAYERSGGSFPTESLNHTSSQQTNVKSSPYASDKSVPKPSSVKNDFHNGSGSLINASNGNYNMGRSDVKDMPAKKPSMFSPEKTPPRKVNHVNKATFDGMPSHNVHMPVSIKKSNHGYESSSRPAKRSDPLDAFDSTKELNFGMSSFNVMNAMMKAEFPELNEFPTTPTNYGTLNFQAQPQFPQMHQHLTQFQPSTSMQKDTKPNEIAPPISSILSSTTSSNSQPIVNGIETNPTLISNLLKEAPTVPHLPAISSTLALPSADTASEDKPDQKDHTHKKKKNKEKHKHKDKEKSREDKEKKRKHKDKDREKHKSKNRDKDATVPTGDESQPLKMTISMDKIQSGESTTASMSSTSQNVGLKIKIPKDIIKTDLPPHPILPAPAPAIKIKISKSSLQMAPENNSRKREREKSSALHDAPMQKVSKISRQQQLQQQQQQQLQQQQNGRSTYTKVSEEDTMTVHSNRYTDTPNKYANKGTSGTY